MPAAAATTGSPMSSVRFQSIDQWLGLWLARLVPVHDWLHGKGISYAVVGAAAAAPALTSRIAVTATGARRGRSLIWRRTWGRIRGRIVDGTAVCPPGPLVVTHVPGVTPALNRNHASACLSRNYKHVVLYAADSPNRRRTAGQPRIRMRPSWATV